MGFFTDLFSGGRTKSLQEVLSATTTVKVHGVLFKIRKLNPIDFARGAKALQMHFETYDAKKLRENMAATEDVSFEKIKDHYRDVYLSAIVEPALSPKKDVEGKIFVDHLFTDWELANELYLKIVQHSYGKKKLKRLVSQQRILSK